MLHLALHAVVPVLVAALFYRPRWLPAAAILLATMVVDADHLLADPVYDPDRCSLGYHPLHTAPAVALYAALFALPLVARRRDRDGAGAPSPAEQVDAPGGSSGLGRRARALHLVGLGLLIHMALDGGDCLL